MRGTSQALCLDRGPSCGSNRPSALVFHASILGDFSGGTKSETDLRKDSTRDWVEIEDEMYAGRAMSSDFLIPRPPIQAGKLACVQAFSLISTLVILLRELLTISSNSWSRSASLYAGDELRR